MRDISYLIKVRIGGKGVTPRGGRGGDGEEEERGEERLFGARGHTHQGTKTMLMLMPRPSMCAMTSGNSCQARCSNTRVSTCVCMCVYERERV